jgi:hypothetical protein
MVTRSRCITAPCVPLAAVREVRAGASGRTSDARRWIPLLGRMSTTTLADLSKDRCLFASGYVQLLAFLFSEIREPPLD